MSLRLFKHLQKPRDLTAGLIIILHLGLHFFPAVNDGRVVASAQRAANLQQRSACLLPHHIHRNLARPGNFAVALPASQPLSINIVIATDSFDDLFSGQH